MGIDPCLDDWIGGRIGRFPFTVPDLRAFQLAALGRVIAYARESAPFYRERFLHMPNLNAIADIQAYPILTADQIVNHGSRMLCVEQERICRVYTSGTTAAPKRLYFTREELDGTVDYFTAGSRQFLSRGDKALLLYPCQREYGPGWLYRAALERLTVDCLPWGVPESGETACRAVAAYHPQLVLAGPETALAMLKTDDRPQFSVLLLSGDALGEAERAALTAAFGCRVFQQYGLTETGFGLGVDCGALGGYHLREADYYTEIADQNGNALPPGEWGRVLITSLRCGAMPLIRYDTGDISRFLPEPCPCGSPLPRLDRIRPRPEPKGYRSSGGSGPKQAKTLFA